MQTLGEVRDLLQVKDITQIEAKGLSRDQIDQVRQFMSRMGAADAAITHPTTTLEDLFIRIVRENTPASANGDGAATSAASPAGARQS
jgi:ABC-2 type transport system ATP-binding protein